MAGIKTYPKGVTKGWKTVCLRLPPDVLDQVKLGASAKGRSMNAEMVEALKSQIAGSGQRGEPAKQDDPIVPAK